MLEIFTPFFMEKAPDFPLYSQLLYFTALQGQSADWGPVALYG